MVRRQLLQVTTLMLCLVFAGRSVAADDGPREVVEAIYSQAAGDDGTYTHDAFTDKSLQKRLFSAALRAALDKDARKTPEGEIGAIEFDPVTSSQDPSVDKLRIETIEENDATATVAAKFLAAKKPQTVTYDLVKEGDSWKVDDIKGSIERTKWSVRAMLAKH